MILYCASNGVSSPLRDVAGLFLGGGVVPDSQTDRNYGGNKNELREGTKGTQDADRGWLKREGILEGYS